MRRAAVDDMADLSLQVAADMVVSLAYQICDAHGDELDRVNESEPLTYVHGYAQVIPGLESGVEGARLGEHRVVELDPDEAFGERDEGAVLEIDRDDASAADEVAVGDELVSEGPDGVQVPLRVLRVSDQIILVDLNHPLAGKRVIFDVRVCALRPARDEELDQARAEFDERIVDDGTIVYGSGSGLGPRQQSSPGGQPQRSDEHLTQLRVRAAEQKLK